MQPFNRTTVECKGVFEILEREELETFNRTTVECKDKIARAIAKALDTFNRTTVECKGIRTIKQNQRVPLIELQ